MTLLKQLITNKEKAKELFKSLETPLLEYGPGIQLQLNELDLNQVIAKVNEEDKIQITAPEGVQVLQASETNPFILEEHFDGLIKANENKHLALHYTILNDTRIIIIPENLTARTPIIITSNTTKKAKAENIIIIAEPTSTATIIEKSSTEKEAFFKSKTIQVYARDGANISFYSVQDHANGTYGFTVKRGKVYRDAKINFTDIILGGKYSQLHMQTQLICPGAKVEKKTISIGQNNEVFDINTESIHKAMHTESAMFSRSVLNENTRTIYRGKIKINKENKKCIAHQKSENLILGEKARCDAVPILEVKNDEVICSHGASIGHIDPEKIFYLTSRGIDEESAQKIIIAGFVEPIIQEFPEGSQEELRQRIHKRIGHQE